MIYGRSTAHAFTLDLKQYCPMKSQDPANTMMEFEATSMHIRWGLPRLDTGSHTRVAGLPRGVWVILRNDETFPNLPERRDQHSFSLDPCALFERATAVETRVPAVRNHSAHYTLFATPFKILQHPLAACSLEIDFA